MTFLEKDLEQIIWESDNEKLMERGFGIDGKKYRQLRIGNYGISDLISVKKCYLENDSVYPYLDITVFELKKEKVGVSAFLQALRYCKGISTFLDLKKPRLRYQLNIVLAAKDVDTCGDFIFLSDLIGYSDFPDSTIKSLDIYSFTYNIDGINFTRHSGYNLTNTGF